MQPSEEIVAAEADRAGERWACIRTRLLTPPPQSQLSEYAVQVPQSTAPPQPFGAEPQVCSPGQTLSGVQPHTPAKPPPPQVSGAAHVPQVRMFLQPSDA